jgi:hypothetical protein
MEKAKESAAKQQAMVDNITKASASWFLISDEWPGPSLTCEQLA